jgi:hypothetical protein
MVKALSRLAFVAGVLSIALLSTRSTVAQLPVCNCSTSPECVTTHGGNPNWQCIIGPGVCVQNGSQTGLCKCIPNPNAFCPAIYDPVTCNGQTYSNQCFADAACAMDCVPGEGE